MYQSLQLPWSPEPSPEETAYRNASDNMVRTQGTVFLLPPARQALVESFNAPPRPKTRMSAGAVALCKHFERGGASSEHGRPHPFWPWPKGSNEHKTELAAGVLENVLGNVRWENVLMLHSYVAIYEVRNSRGFGLRWTLNLEGKGARATRHRRLTSSPQRQHQMTRFLPGRGAADKGLGGEDGKEDEKEKVAPAASALRISKVAFRGFVEPILNLDHELPES
ncbi:hypothetical protein PG997_014126 [Apiospora hydei]|uniref:Uncharacterized protein n=1 Tax=Apiospora hydei TaxID=1337664 RepID=A0ABR1V846_9PEZI